MFESVHDAHLRSFLRPVKPLPAGLLLSTMLAGATLPLASSAQCIQPFLRGDSNEDGDLDLSDGIRTLIFLFAGSSEVRCEDAADANDSGDLDLSDAIFTFAFLFGGGPAPPLPGMRFCGGDPTLDVLGCTDYRSCPEDCGCTDGEMRSCGSSSTGPCRLGVQVCANGAWGPCEGSVEPGAELCDGVDNDCNGVADNGFEQLGQACDGGDGDLCLTGTFTCTADLTALVCSEIGPGMTEICDEQDNDCDGGIDEDFDADQDGWTTCKGDCDDLQAVVNPGMSFDPIDGLDNDCDGDIDEGPFTASYARDIQPVWTASCTSATCHDPGTPAQGLDLTAAVSYRNLVNKLSQQARRLDLVEPLDPDRSYLWHKLNDTQRSVGGAGTSMPRGGPLLPQATRDRIKTWILEGAPE